MELPSIDLIELLYKLLPGFLAATIFHSLTPYPKRDVLDRVVAALLFTMFAQVAVALAKPLIFLAGKKYGPWGDWTPEVELGWAAAFAALLGTLWATLINNDCTHWPLRKIWVTRRSSLPMDWFYAFAKFQRYIIINFDNGRRLMGWPHRWPDRPNGYFLLEYAEWIFKDGTGVRMDDIEYFLVHAKGIESIEFLRFNDDEELKKHAARIEAAHKRLRKAHQGKARTDESAREPAAAAQSAAGSEGNE